MNRRRVYRRRITLDGETPKLKQGDIFDDLVITMYRGQSRVHPVKHTVLSKDHHWYMCKCTCGTTITKTQQQLLDARRKRACPICVNEKE